MSLLSKLVPALVFASGLSAQVPLLNVQADARSGAAFARYTATVGDIDRDGVQDFIVGITNDSSHVGAAHVYSGRDGHRLFRVTGDPTVKYQFGDAVGAAGDINLDGYPDFIVATATHPKNGQSAGAVQCFSGKDGKVLHTVYGLGAGDLFGTHVSNVGDIDGDGHPDFGVGAPENGDPVLNYGPGYARVFSGKTGKLIHHFQGYELMSEFGYVINPAGDVDKDGTPDIIIGSLLERGGLGSARVYSGRTKKVIHSFLAPVDGDHYGISVAAVGDVDRDGYIDILVGDPNPYSFLLSGALFVYSGKTGKQIHRIDGSSTSRMLGMCVAAMGDVNNDGYPDFAGGDPMDVTLGSPTGSVRVYSGKDASELYVIYGNGGGFGITFQNMGDLNGDGLPELICGSPGEKQPGHLRGTASIRSLSSTSRFGFGCSQAKVAPSLDATAFRIGKQTTMFLRGGANEGGALFLSSIPDVPLILGPTCHLHLDVLGMMFVSAVRTDSVGRWTTAIGVPNRSSLVGSTGALQCALGMTNSPLGIDMSNGLYFKIVK